MPLSFLPSLQCLIRSSSLYSLSFLIPLILSNNFPSLSYHPHCWIINWILNFFDMEVRVFDRELVANGGMGKWEGVGGGRKRWTCRLWWWNLVKMMMVAESLGGDGDGWGEGTLEWGFGGGENSEGGIYSYGKRRWRWLRRDRGR